MSSVYVLEPPTRGKVILNTTEGPLDIELWPKEAPKAVRNFVQLCVDGYYDNTDFHRIIKTFMVQGGDRSGTGTGGESIYGTPFADEFHSRLRFNHRGLVACANAGTPNSNKSQFFITLDRCEWLDKKNTIFGKVTGDTLYNLLKLGEIETGVDDKPLEPVPKILSVEVLWSPFDDIVPTESKQAVTTAEKKDDKKKTKNVKQLNLLSFGEEAEQEEHELATFNVKIKSSHDVLDDPRLLKGDIDGAERTLEKLKLFQSNLFKAKAGGVDRENVEGEDDTGWLAHRLTFAQEKGGTDKMARNEDPEQYAVYDPLLEKGKEKFNKMQAKMKRKQREWTGKSLT